MTGKRRKPRVLLVDDYPDVRNMYAEHFRDAGWQVEDVTNGEEAYAIAAAFQPAVIVMDMVMPVLDGVRATRVLKLDERTRHIPIVVLSGRPDMALNALAVGADAIVYKPCEPHKLVAAVEAILKPTTQTGKARQRR